MQNIDNMQYIESEIDYIDIDYKTIEDMLALEREDIASEIY
jgi:hypothetical protein